MNIANNKQLLLKDCLYIPTFSLNLISISRLEDNNYNVNFKNKQAIILEDNKEIITFDRVNNLYQLSLKPKSNSSIRSVQTIDTIFSTIDSTSNLLLWHKRLGHRRD
jgi:hypothetical protein